MPIMMKSPAGQMSLMRLLVFFAFLLPLTLAHLQTNGMDVHLYVYDLSQVGFHGFLIRVDHK